MDPYRVSAPLCLLEEQVEGGLAGLSQLSSGFLMTTMVAGVVGGALFVYGKKMQRAPQLVGGLALIVYPSFVAGTGAALGIGVGIIAAIYGAVRAGF